MSARFEIVRSSSGWHARFRAANGRIVWWTENYKRRRGAYHAVCVMNNGDIFRSTDVDERQP